jgi:hypothetical protein
MCWWHRWIGLAVVLVGLGALSACKSIESGQAITGAVGASCADADDCALIEFDESLDVGPTCLKMPGGYCSIECSGDIWDCDDQSVCDALGDQAYYCLDGCLTANENGDCRADYRCSLRTDVVNLDGGEVGVCLPRCEADIDCEEGRRCAAETGDCVPRGERATGDACETNESCNGGLCLTGISFRGGYCSGRCGTQFVGCEEGSMCSTLGGEAMCLLICEGDSNCRSDAGYVCRQVGERRDQAGDVQAVSVCVPRCESNSECDDGEHCDLASGGCVAGAGEPNPDGAFCASDEDCQSGQCLLGDLWPNGYCNRDCGGDGDCADATCREGRCHVRCAATLDCRAGYVCSGEACSSRCQGDADCGQGLVCSESLGTCVVPSMDVSTLEVVTISDGINVSGVPSDDLTLEVPSDALSFAIMAEGSGDDLMVIAEMTDPTGRQIYDFQDSFGSEVRFFPGRDHITQFVPTSPRTAPRAGTYRFKLIKDGAAARIGVTAVLKRASGEPSEGQLDINVFFANLTDISASSAATDRDLQVALEKVRSVYAQQEVRVGEVHYCDLPSGDQDRFAVIDSVKGPGAELGRMFALSARAADLGCSSGQAINFFMVREIVGGRAGFIILGISGGIPGPGAVHGTTHSGVAVTMAGFRRNPQQLGLTMAHEGGHYLGLFHTTEAEGQAFDPLPDTPECGPGQDRDADGIVDNRECRSAGASNLMFWAAGDDAEQVTGDQGFIVLRNPAIK